MFDFGGIAKGLIGGALGPSNLSKIAPDGDRGPVMEGAAMGAAPQSGGFSRLAQQLLSRMGNKPSFQPQVQHQLPDGSYVSPSTWVAGTGGIMTPKFNGIGAGIASIMSPFARQFHAPNPTGKLEYHPNYVPEPAQMDSPNLDFNKIENVLNSRYKKDIYY